MLDILSNIVFPVLVLPLIIYVTMFVLAKVSVFASGIGLISDDSMRWIEELLI